MSCYSCTTSTCICDLAVTKGVASLHLCSTLAMRVLWFVLNIEEVQPLLLLCNTKTTGVGPRFRIQISGVVNFFSLKSVLFVFFAVYFEICIIQCRAADRLFLGGFWLSNSEIQLDKGIKYCHCKGLLYGTLLAP